MQAPRLDHVNIRTTRLAESVRFYAEVIGLEAVDPPPPLDPAAVQWMRAPGAAAILHLSTPGSLGMDAPTGDGSGAIHHVALEAFDHDAMTARLDRLGIAYRRNHVEAIGLRQLFVHDPDGVLLELNYRGED